MAKTSAIQRNLKRIKLANKFLKKRQKLKKIINNKKLSLAERFDAQLKISKLPKNSAMIRRPHSHLVRSRGQQGPQVRSRARGRGSPPSVRRQDKIGIE